MSDSHNHFIKGRLLVLNYKREFMYGFHKTLITLVKLLAITVQVSSGTINKLT